MTSNTIAESTSGSAKARPGRYFYVGVGAFLVVFVLWGFHHFYLGGRAYPGRPLTPEIRTLVILHGTAMAAWILLMLAQPLLIATGNRKLHMTVGKFGAGLAGLIVILGMKLGVASVKVAPPGAMIWGVTPKQFMAVPIVSMVLFGGLVTAAVVNRKRPERHRSLMLLATMSAMSAAVSRIDALNAFYLGTVFERVFGAFFWTLVIAVGFAVVRWALTRKVERTYAIGCAGLILADAFIVWFEKSGVWDGIASALLR